jgi:hypothetical protein
LLTLSFPPRTRLIPGLSHPLGQRAGAAFPGSGDTPRPFLGLPPRWIRTVSEQSGSGVTAATPAQSGRRPLILGMNPRAAAQTVRGKSDDDSSDSDSS